MDCRKYAKSRIEFNIFNTFNNVRIKVEPIREGARVPEKSHPWSIGYDIYCPEDTYVPTGRSVIPSGFRIQLPIGLEGKIEPRSGFSAKGFEGVILKGVDDSNQPIMTGKVRRFDCDVKEGKVDPFYVEEVGVIVKNLDEPFICKAGTRIAQLTIYRVSPWWRLCLGKVNLNRSRGGGFGHSGTHGINK